MTFLKHFPLVNNPIKSKDSMTKPGTIAINIVFMPRFKIADRDPNPFYSKLSE